MMLESDSRRSWRAVIRTLALPPHFVRNLRRGQEKVVGSHGICHPLLVIHALFDERSAGNDQHQQRLCHGGDGQAPGRGAVPEYLHLHIGIQVMTGQKTRLRREVVRHPVCRNQIPMVGAVYRIRLFRRLFQQVRPRRFMQIQILDK